MLDGWDILDKMESLQVLGATASKKKLEHRPLEPPIIERVTVHANPLADEMIVYPTPTSAPEKRL
jgi:peptidyl-prolyl cis-trans isomerase-like 3